MGGRSESNLQALQPRIKPLIYFCRNAARPSGSLGVNKEQQ